MSASATKPPMPALAPIALVGGFVFVGALLTGCTDPVRDAEIEALGPEAPGVTPNADHRPGQPCLHCHSPGGPAESKRFAVAGTVFKRATGPEGADAVTVQFIDAKGNAPVVAPETGPTGNFYVPFQDWPDLAFPFRTGVYEDLDKLRRPMLSLIGREPSCNWCHRPLPEGDLTDSQLKKTTSSAGQIFFEQQ
jgi:hypothetical protein